LSSDSVPRSTSAPGSASPTSSTADNKLTVWKQRQLEEEKARKEKEAKDAEEKRQRLEREINASKSTTPDLTVSPASNPFVVSPPPEGDEENVSAAVSKPKRHNVKAATANPITNAANLSKSSPSPAARHAIPGGLSLAAAGAAIAEKRKAVQSIKQEDDSDGVWGKGEEKEELFTDYKMGAPASAVLLPMGFGAFDAAALKGNLKKTQGIAGDTHH